MKTRNKQEKLNQLRYIKLNDVNITKMNLDLMQEFELTFAYWFGAFGASTIIQNCTNQIHHLLSLAQRYILTSSCPVIFYVQQLTCSKLSQCEIQGQLKYRLSRDMFIMPTKLYYSTTCIFFQMMLALCPFIYNFLLLRPCTLFVLQIVLQNHFGFFKRYLAPPTFGEENIICNDPTASIVPYKD